MRNPFCLKRVPHSRPLISKSALLGTVDDIVLKRVGEGGEECAVARYSNYQIFVFFGVLLSIDKSFLGNHVVLNVHTLLIKVASEVSHELFKACHA